MLRRPPSSSLLEAYNIHLLAEPHVEMHLELDGCTNSFKDCANVAWGVSPIENDIIGDFDFDETARGERLLCRHDLSNGMMSCVRCPLPPL